MKHIFVLKKCSGENNISVQETTHPELKKGVIHVPTNLMNCV